VYLREFNSKDQSAID